MTSGPEQEREQEPEHARTWTRKGIAAAVILAVVVGFAYAINEGSGANAKDLDFDCFYPVRIDGASPGQGGAVRCYLQALADHDATEMRTAIPVDDFGGDETITPSTFRFSSAARSGVASVKIIGSDVSSAYALARIRFADGEVDIQPLYIVDPTSFAGWRFWQSNEHSATTS